MQEFDIPAFSFYNNGQAQRPAPTVFCYLNIIYNLRCVEDAAPYRVILKFYSRGGRFPRSTGEMSRSDKGGRLCTSLCPPVKGLRALPKYNQSNRNYSSFI